MVRRAPYLLTLANALAGIGAIYLALNSQPMLAVFLILAGAVFDLGDGWLARKIGSESTRGAAADVVADMISFGAAPALLMATVDGSVAGRVTAVIYFLAIVFRLNRFRLKAPLYRQFTGMPSPMTALAVAPAAIVEQHWFPGSFFAEGVTIAFSLIAISKTPFPKWGHPCLKIVPRVLWTLLWLVHLFTFIFWQAEAILSAMLVYLIIGPTMLNRYLKQSGTGEGARSSS